MDSIRLENLDGVCYPLDSVFHPDTLDYTAGIAASSSYSLNYVAASREPDVERRVFTLPDSTGRLCYELRVYLGEDTVIAPAVPVTGADYFFDRIDFGRDRVYFRIAPVSKHAKVEVAMTANIPEKTDSLYVWKVKTVVSFADNSLATVSANGNGVYTLTSNPDTVDVVVTAKDADIKKTYRIIEKDLNTVFFY